MIASRVAFLLGALGASLMALPAHAQSPRELDLSVEAGWGMTVGEIGNDLFRSDFSEYIEYDRIPPGPTAGLALWLGWPAREWALQLSARHVFARELPVRWIRCGDNACGSPGYYRTSETANTTVWLDVVADPPPAGWLQPLLAAGLGVRRYTFAFGPVKVGTVSDPAFEQGFTGFAFHVAAGVRAALFGSPVHVTLGHFIGKIGGRGGEPSRPGTDGGLAPANRFDGWRFQELAFTVGWTVPLF